MLTFREVSKINASRLKEWHGKNDSDWTLADWGNALAGETGELCNIIKKLRRLESGLKNSKDKENDIFKLREDLEKEAADVFLYLDLIATVAGFNLPAAIKDKFNEVSDRYGFPQKL